MLTLLLGAVLGFVVASVLHAYPKDVVTRHRYCLRCAEFEETYHEGAILGARQSSRSREGGPIHDLLERAIGQHEHEFTPWATLFPTHGVPNEHPEIAHRVLTLRDLERHADSVALFAGSMAEDRERTVALLQRLIDPDVEFDAAMVSRLQRETSWPKRWAEVDAALGR